MGDHVIRFWHPWPAQLTVNWRSKPTGYHQVAPLVVVEIRADIAPDEVPLDLDREA